MCLQEVHGTIEEAQRLHRRWHRRMLILYTPGRTSRRAGCLFQIQIAILTRIGNVGVLFFASVYSSVQQTMRKQNSCHNTYFA